MPQDFLAAWQRYQEGREPLDRLARILGESLNRDVRAATTVQRFVLSARDRGELDETGFDGLMEAIDRFLTEDVPTEYSLDGDDSPAVLVPGHVESSTPVAPLLPGTVLKKRFRLEELLATGPCHQVFQATDLSPAHGETGTTLVALKVVSAASPADSPLVAALRRESGIGRRLTHANIVRSFDLDQDGPYTFLCLEWLDGESLARILDARRNRPMPRVQALQLIEGICRGLSAAHAQGVIHGDLKPGNIFVTRNGQVKLLDFGAARTTDDTGPPALRGRTPEYASCEVLEGADPEPADDLFSAALVAYRVLAGERAFGPRTAREAETEGLAPARIENLTPAQWRALNRALAFRRRERQAGITAFLAELKGPRDDGHAPRAVAATGSPSAAAGSTGQRLRVAGGALAIALAGIALGLKLGSGPDRTSTAPDSGQAAVPAPVTPARIIRTPSAPPVPPASPADGTAMDPSRTLPPGRIPVPTPATAAAAGGPGEVGPVSAMEPVPVPQPATGEQQGPPAALMAGSLPENASPDTPADGAPDTGDAAAAEPVPFSSLKLRRYVEPRYPSLSAVRGEPGWVDVQFTVDAQGMPGQLQVLAAEPAGRFEEAALAAVRRWRFQRPAGSEAVVTQIRVRFAPE